VKGLLHILPVFACGQTHGDGDGADVQVGADYRQAKQQLLDLILWADLVWTEEDELCHVNLLRWFRSEKVQKHLSTLKCLFDSGSSNFGQPVVLTATNFSTRFFL